ncbi:dopamine beta-hydroxylase [Trichonephila clavata]|uniref:Dopamine beta-hydroxylase n=1 Tax=Trichonephila clavata TaxID=2740835 RepID=A0A8X6J475_TRICU|nr:dopamine beta-hydroxylase [Trichonephila clavata]
MLLRCLGVLLILQVPGLRLTTVDNSLITIPENNANAVLYLKQFWIPMTKCICTGLLTTKKKTVTFEVRARISEHDWIGIGFSDRGEVKKADLCILWTDRKRKNRFQVKE